MSRKATGNVEPFTRADGSVYHKIRIRLGDGSRKRRPIPAKHDVDSENDEIREAYALAKQEEENRTGKLLRAKRKRAAERAGASTPRGAMTCNDYFDKFLEARALDGKPTTHERSRWRAWIEPHIGSFRSRRFPVRRSKTFAMRSTPKCASESPKGSAKGSPANRR